MADMTKKSRLTPPLMYAFRAAHEAKDSAKKVDHRNEAGDDPITSLVAMVDFLGGILGLMRGAERIHQRRGQAGLFRHIGHAKPTPRVIDSNLFASSSGRPCSSARASR